MSTENNQATTVSPERQTELQTKILTAESQFENLTPEEKQFVADEFARWCIVVPENTTTNSVVATAGIVDGANVVDTSAAPMPNADTNAAPAITTDTKVTPPTTGRIVQYFPNEKDGELNSAVLPGIVISADGTMVNLHVFPDNNHTSIWRSQIPMAAEDNSGPYWNYPVRN